MENKLSKIMEWARLIILSAIILIIFGLISQKDNKLKDDEKLREIAIKEKGDHKNLRSIDFLKLKSINSDVVGWIYIPDTKIDYPILLSPQDDYYLYKNIYKKDDKHGCIYIQEGTTSDFTDDFTVVFGHNMRDGSMFRDIERFLDGKYFRDHSVAYIYTPDKDMILEFLYSESLGEEYPVIDYDKYKKEDKYVALFTCQKSSNRAVVVGRLRLT